MFPILYSKNTQKEDFAYSGYGFIKDCTKCVVTEEENGSYELELAASAQDRLAQRIVPGTFIKAVANSHDDPQIFEIYSVSVTDNEITARAQHNRYIAFNNVLSDTIQTTQARTPLQWWDIADSYLVIANLWEFETDITATGVVTAAKDRPIRLGDLLQGKEGSMLDVFGGEYHYDNFKIRFLSRRGRDTGKCLRWGSNISSYAQNSDSTTVYSHLFPYAYVKAQIYETNENTADRPVYSDVINLNNPSLTYQRALAYEFSDALSGDTMFIYQSSGSPKNYAELKNKLDVAAAKYVQKNGSALTNITANIIVDLPEALDSLGDIELTDTVLVNFEPLGFSVRARVVKTEYDALAERYNKIELGTIKKTLSDLFSGKNIGGV